MDDPSEVAEARRALAEAVRRACVQAASAAFEDARTAGLCAEGAWEVALGALRSLDLERMLETPPDARSGA